MSAPANATQAGSIIGEVTEMLAKNPNFAPLITIIVLQAVHIVVILTLQILKDRGISLGGSLEKLIAKVMPAKPNIDEQPVEDIVDRAIDIAEVVIPGPNALDTVRAGIKAALEALAAINESINTEEQPRI